MPWTIYCHTHIESGRRYIGLTRQTWQQRWKNHCHAAKRSKEGRWHFPNAIRKYGPEAFSHQVLEVCHSLEEANEAEDAWICSFSTRFPEFGFNLAKGGQHTPHPIRKNPWDDPAFREARTAESRARAVDPDYVARMAVSSQALGKDPAFREKVGASVREAYGRDPDSASKASSRSKSLWQDPEFHAKVVTATKAKAKDPGRLEKISAAAKAHAATPEGRAARSAASRAAWDDPAFREARSAEVRARAADPEWRATCAPKRHANAVKTHCKRGHEFTDENTRTSRGRRTCRACRRDARTAGDRAFMVPPV